MNKQQILLKLEEKKIKILKSNLPLDIKQDRIRQLTHQIILIVNYNQLTLEVFK